MFLGNFAHTNAYASQCGGQRETVKDTAADLPTFDVCFTPPITYTSSVLTVYYNMLYIFPANTSFVRLLNVESLNYINQWLKVPRSLYKTSAGNTYSV